ncbi:MAG: hypothetical protein WAW36_06210 [Methylovulum miyakonense]|uniref:hypothetical protein n=1 Tax=Methylovulum miyakonense TaxID=645578 RepID=UPI003BB7C6DD
MTQLEHIQNEISALPKSDFAKLKNWLDDKDWEEWETQLAADSATGKLDFLKWEALATKTKGTLKER